MRAIALLAFAAALAAPSAAQLNGEALFDSAVAKISAAKKTAAPLEATIAFSDGRKPLVIRFAYAGSRREERNDYIPPYAESSYESKDGYALVVVTEEGAAVSKVLIAKGPDWIGAFDGVANAALTSGDAVPLGAVLIKDAKGETKATVSLRGSRRA